MAKKKPAADSATKTERQPHRVRVPGFIVQEEVGLGDVIKRVTYAFGITPCAGCQRRAAALNRWISFYH